MGNRTFNRVLALAIILLILASCDFQDGKEGRSFSNLSLLESIELDKPYLRFQFEDESFYTYDFSTKQIILLNQDFEELKSLGSQGDGPKENLLVRDYFILDEDRVGLFDVEKNTYKIQDFEDSVYFYHKFSKNIQKGALINDHEVVIGSFGNHVKLEFDIFDFKTNEYSPIQKVNDFFSEENSGLIYEGQLKVENGKMYFMSYFSSFWFIYDLKDGTVKSGTYWFEYENPKVLDLGGAVMLDNAPELFYDSFFFKNQIVIITNFGDKEFPDQRILDFYSLDDFEYIKSIPLPNLNEATPSEGFHINENKIGIRYEDKLYFFELN